MKIDTNFKKFNNNFFKNEIIEKVLPCFEKDKYLKINEIPTESLKALTINPIKQITPIEKIRNHFKLLYEKLSKKMDFEYIRRFKSDYYFDDINKILRLGEETFTAKKQNLPIGNLKDFHLPSYLKDNEKLNEISEDIFKKRIRNKKIKEFITQSNEIIKELDRIFENSVLPENVTVYRGVSQNTANKVLTSGGIYKDKGFVSTSYKRAEADTFGSHILEIEVPKGSKAIDMKTALPHTRWEDWEEELLLPRNSRFELKEFDEKNSIIRLKLLAD
ncbi:MAG: ADP-ribosyltransferase [bacterium]